MQTSVQGFSGVVRGQRTAAPATVKSHSGRVVPAQVGFGKISDVQRKLLVVIPYWEQDREAAEDLAQLITDLERTKIRGIDLMLIQRFDAPEFSKTTLQSLAVKWDKIHVHVCRRKDGTSYPFSSNQMFFDVITMFGQGATWNRDYYAFLWMEPDCVPTRSGWMNELGEAFKLFEQQGKAALGFVHDDPVRHMNGVAVYAINMWSRVPGGRLSGGRPGIAFDIEIAKEILPIVQDSPLFHFEYRLPTISPEQLFQPRREGVVPAVFHGVKDDSARAAVRARYLGAAKESTGKRPTVFTFFNPIPGKPAGENASIINLWQEAWRARGFNPIVLRQVDAVKNAHYASFVESVQKLPCLIAKETQMNRFMRWLALDAMGGGLMTDYDVMPHRLSADSLGRLTGFHVTRPRDNTPAIAMVYADKPSLARWLDRLQNYAPRDEDKIDGRVNVTDLNVLASCIQELGVVPESWVLNHGEPGWTEAAAVHFCAKSITGATKSAAMEQFLRSPVVRTEPPMLTPTESAQPEHTLPSVTANEVIEKCPNCGTPMTTIRGRHPDDENRKVCAQCLQELLESEQNTLVRIGEGLPPAPETSHLTESVAAPEQTATVEVAPAKRRGRPPKTKAEAE